ncbi:MAG: efflux RND transporter permease subunit [Bacteroidales bacterium]|nr:efflux RND transporter permease subunit [Bacteroidales bacterium]
MGTTEIKKKKLRDFKLTSLALKNRNTIYLLIFMILFFGIYSYRSLPKELMPEIVWPQIMIQTQYFGNSPEDIESIITRPIEKEVEGVKGLKEITSVSAQDISMIFVEFNTDVDLEDALQRVKDRVDRAESELPSGDDLTGPIVFDVDFSEFPIININMSGEYSIEELKNYAENLQDELEEIPEVSKVLIEGINEREVKVNADLVKMEALSLTFYDIQFALSQENLTMSGGEILLHGMRRGLRVEGEIDDPRELEEIIVKKDGNKTIYLRDVADVVYGFAEPVSFARLDRHPVVSVQVVKKGGENLLSATGKIFKIIDQAREDKLIPDGLRISITNDQSEEVISQLDNLNNSMIIAIILVVLVLYYFLGARNAMFVGLAIPMSLFLSFVVIGIINYRINMMVLFSLILALGMLVDNAIVVVENIYRFVDEGYKPWEAARLATSEIAVPIIASTLTTLAAFFPLALWTGVVGEFMKILPITLIIVLSASLFVALVITPVVAATFIRKKGEGAVPDKKRGYKVALVMIGAGLLMLIPGWRLIPNLLIIFGIIGILNLAVFHGMQLWFQDHFLPWLEVFYERVLRFALKRRNPLWFFSGTFGLFLFAIFLWTIRQPEVLFFPDNDPNYINVICELPIGTDIRTTDAFIHKLENDIAQFLEPDRDIIESILTTIGKGDPYDFSSGPQPQKALMTISFIDFTERKGKNTSKIMREVTERIVGNYPGVEIEITKEEMGPPTGKEINLEIAGQDFDELVFLADSIRALIKSAGIQGIEGLKMNISTDKPELLVSIDRDKARRFGLSTYQIASDLRTAVYGFNATDYKIGEDEYPVMIRLKDEYRYNLSALQNMKISYTDNGITNLIPLSSVADFDYTSTFSSVRRKDLDRVVTLYSNVVEGYNPTVVNQKIKDLMINFKMPPGYRYEFTGEQEEQDESFNFLIRALLIAVALIFLILVTQFNSVIRTVIILVSVLFSTIGVIGGLATFKMPFVIIMTGVGIISLAGIVVNNAIVLVDYIQLLRAGRREELGLEDEVLLPANDATECLVKAGKVRLRPVLLTAITTLLGLIPMAIGMNFDFGGFLHNYDPDFYIGGDQAQFWGPLAWTIIFGLTFSTFLTLVIVPVMYRLTSLVQLRWVRLITVFKERNGNGNHNNR